MAGVAGGEAVVTGVAVGLLTGVAVGLAVGVSATVGDGKGVALGAGVEGWPPEGSAGFCSHAVARKLATTTVKKRHVFMPLDTDARAVRLFKTRCRGPENRAFCKTRRVLQVTEKRKRALGNRPIAKDLSGSEFGIPLQPGPTNRTLDHPGEVPWPSGRGVESGSGNRPGC